MVHSTQSMPAHTRARQLRSLACTHSPHTTTLVLVVEKLPYWAGQERRVLLQDHILCVRNRLRGIQVFGARQRAIVDAMAALDAALLRNKHV